MERIVVVLGARVDPSGKPKPMLQARLSAALSAFEALKDATLLLSGRPDECAAMEAFCLAAGVPETAMVIDSASFRTVDTIRYLARHHSTATCWLVSQRFHLQRVGHLAKHAGLSARLVPAEDARYGRISTLRVLLREAAAWMRVPMDRLHGMRGGTED